jgi:hypothetical protein
MVVANSSEASDAALALLSTKTKQDETITALNLQAKLTDVQPVDLQVGGSAIATGSGAANAQTLRVVQAADSPLTVLTGPLTESAPASDTASSALNGRLQRIAQNLTGLTSVFKIAGQFLAQSVGVALPRKDTIAGISTSTTAANANLLNSTAVATDVRDYNSAELTIISTATTGSYTIQCSPDPSFATGVTTLQAFESTVQNANPINAAITPTNTSRRFGLNLTGINYIRVNLTTGVIGVQAIAVLSQMAFVPYQTNVQQATGTSLVTNLGAAVAIAASQTLATVTTVNTVTTVTSAQLGAQSPATVDVASAAITTSATTSTVQPTWGVSQFFSVVVTAVSGTSSTYGVAVQESPDGGTTWLDVYTFPLIIAIGTYTSPLIAESGRVYRYVQTVAGTASPSFTRAINRYMSNVQVQPYSGVLRQGGIAPSTDVLIGARLIRRILATNTSATALFLQFHNSGVALTTGAVPFAETYALAATTGDLWVPVSALPIGGLTYGPYTRVALSTTRFSYTAPGSTAGVALMVETTS